MSQGDARSSHEWEAVTGLDTRKPVQEERVRQKWIPGDPRGGTAVSMRERALGRPDYVIRARTGSGTRDRT